MVSKYDIFYLLVVKGEMKVSDILKLLKKPKQDYQIIFNHVIELEKDNFVKREEKIKVLINKKSRELFKLINFCIKNRINYNLFFKKSMLDFLKIAIKKEFFSIKVSKINPRTFNFYVNVLEKNGLLLIVSKKPYKCKLLRNHFFLDLMRFFSKEIKFYTSKKHNFILQIKKELRIYKQNLKIHRLIIDDLEEKQETNFIYTSLNMEGNPLTLPETQKLVLKQIVPEKQNLIGIQEVTNYKKAVDFMITNTKREVRLDLNLILKYHAIGMDQIHGAGKIRKHNVKIKGNPKFKTSDWNLIYLKLDELMKKYEEFILEKKDIKKIIKFAGFFHNEFQRIHPFNDGNSRTSRLLMLHILREHRIPLLDFPLGYVDRYLSLTKKSTERDDKKFISLIEEMVFFNLKRINFYLV